MWNILENPWLLLTVAGIALVVVGMLRQDHPEWGTKPLLIPLLLALLAFGLDAAFDSPTESINYIITESKNAAAAGDVDGIVKFVSPNYHDRFHTSKTNLENSLRTYLSKADLEKIKSQSHRVTIDSKTSATCEMNLVIHLSNDSQYAAAGSLVFVGLQCDFEKLKKKWYLKTVELVSVNNDPVNWSDIQ